MDTKYCKDCFYHSRLNDYCFNVQLTTACYDIESVPIVRTPKLLMLCRKYECKTIPPYDYPTLNKD